MANHEHIKIIHEGVEAWNRWRRRNPEVLPDLQDALLKGRNLRDADFIKADLSSANLSSSDLSAAKLTYANLINSNLSNANLSKTYLYDANLRGANFTNAVLCNASIDGLNLSYARFSNTVLASVNLLNVKGLSTINHSGPSNIGIDIIRKSKGSLPAEFLRGCGFSDWEIEVANLNNPNLSNEEITDILYRIHYLRAHQAIQISPLFISYNHSDTIFVDNLEQYLNVKGIRFWRDIHHATAGRLEKQIDRAIRYNPTVLLILSEHSVKSDWVQHEARLARQLELETGRDVLCPIALDSSWESCKWPERLREQIMEYNVLDFSGWKSDEVFQLMFARLIEGLNLFYK